VSLSGDGADEVFGGYRKHQAELRYRTPGLAERTVIALGPLWRHLPRSRNGAITDLFRKLDRFALAGTGTAERRWLNLASFDTDGDASALVPHAGHPIQLDDRDTGMTQGLRRMPGLNGALLNDVMTVLPNDMLYKVDLTSMAHALEVRTPFLDRRVVEFAFSLAAEQRFQKGSGKQLLRTTFGHLLPLTVLGRRKQGFEVPLRELFLGPLEGLVATTLRKDLVEAAGLDWQAVMAIRERLRSKAPGQAQATVHALLVYLAWWRSNGAGPT
jgi:asparagine synthase (glutamine-hydrolysing)